MTIRIRRVDTAFCRDGSKSGSSARGGREPALCQQSPMRFSIVSRVLPLKEGGPPHRALLALGDGLLAEGHTVECWSWGPEEPAEELPAWSRWAPLPPEPQWRVRAWAIFRPRHETARGGWAPWPDSVPLGEETLS